MNSDITLLDGAYGTCLWNIAEREGVKKEPVWKYNIEHPEFITELTRMYMDAGSSIIQANTFGANGPAVKRSSSYSVEEVVSAAVRLAKDAVAGSGVKIALSAGPLTQLMEPYGDLEEEEVEEIYTEMLTSGVKAGADLIVLETFIDLEMMKVAARVAKGLGVPVFCTMTFEKVGKTMMGNSVEDIIAALEPIGVDAIGMNCSLGPDLALPVISAFVGKTRLPLIFKPNAGKPVVVNGKETTEFDPVTFADDVSPALDFVTYIGSCCGSSPEYISELRRRIEGRQN